MHNNSSWNLSGNDQEKILDNNSSLNYDDNFSTCLEDIDLDSLIQEIKNTDPKTYQIDRDYILDNLFDKESEKEFETIFDSSKRRNMKKTSKDAGLVLTEIIDSGKPK